MHIKYKINLEAFKYVTTRLLQINYKFLVGRHEGNDMRKLPILSAFYIFFEIGSDVAQSCLTLKPKMILKV